ncbi:MAG TPA: hypothetical protein DCE44_09865 [Verrucomicrobiales bacterium]|nr:hypothetical protein [Verrucomicrobiales bacterium]
MARHIIQRQVLELRLPESLTRRPVESEVEFLLTHEVWPKLDAICSRFEVAGQTVHFDRLEIEVAAMPPAKLRSQWSREVCRQFEADLRRRLASLTFSPNLFGDDTAIASPELATSAATPERAHPTETAKLEALNFFLRHGLLPWWWDRNKANMERLVTELLEVATPGMRHLLRSSLLATETATRVSAQFSSKTMRAILELLVADPQSGRATVALHERITRHFPLMASFHSKPAALMALEACLLSASCRLIGRSNLNESEVVAEMLKQVPPLNLELMEAALGASPSGTKGQRAAELSDGRAVSIPPTDADLTTDTAGLVLLWPYLERFFAQLELIKDHAFRDPATRWRAVHLLHFLAMGEEGAPEHTLALPKVLCAVPFAEAVPFSVGLTETEKSESEQLLRAVIRNWPPLKNTSIGGFRQSFLQREGRLALPEDATPMPGWKLRVERKGHDILLDQLPWGLYLVKLPWMPQPLYVEW